MVLTSAQFDLSYFPLVEMVIMLNLIVSLLNLIAPHAFHLDKIGCLINTYWPIGNREVHFSGISN